LQLYILQLIDDVMAVLFVYGGSGCLPYCCPDDVDVADVDAVAAARAAVSADWTGGTLAKTLRLLSTSVGSASALVTFL
jgi:hypothetical protein